MDKRIQQLNRALVGQRLGHPLLWFDTVGSTNDVLKDKAQAGAPEGCTIIADGQTCGRGQRGKEWLSPEGKGVYMSLLLRPKWPASEASLISMLAVVAVAQSLEKIGVRHVKVKWPNDVLVRGKKIAGILVEPRISRQVMDFAIIGIGINVRHNNKDLLLLDNGAVTSCRLEGVRIDCDKVFIQVLQELESCYDLAQQNQKDHLLEAWTQRRITP
ncbi:MAG: biotin--[acetyl-CoA-carboxylase] ligase [Verrucomicrobia bacterium]|nr:biotin--[acetyl-CoA-carboxylase] ligase [Verrucomicrobiota bacterium]MBU4429375.1 biotin--[acetyl-CoA-carboxylase] ligase [Verrucomicrobiota bacterium]MCG2680338.1 biotin--[acetyl-CoA-carboxylase] ligase [Kiritimatiellia bacterium]